MACRIERETWQTLSQAYAFFGNSLLKPMTQTATVGLDPAFWEEFPTFESPEASRAAAACADCARRMLSNASDAGEDPAVRCSVEFTRLFVGPPRPAAAPWETMHRQSAGESRAGFGAATFEMRALLRDAGLVLSNENHQYEDHLGIELLHLSELCRRLAENAEASHEDEEAVCSFVEGHPLAWVESLHEGVRAAARDGYFDCLLALCRAVLAWHAETVRSRS